MSLFIPGRILGKITNTALNGVANVNVLDPTGYTTLLSSSDRKKCNAVMINYPNARSQRAALVDVWVSLDGNNASSTNGINITDEGSIITYGQPTIRMIASAANTDVVEVYLLYIPGMGF